MDELIQQIRDRLKEAQDAEAPIRREALEDLRFANGDQWPDEQKRLRASDGRPCLVSNRIRAVIKQIANEQRQQKPSITISPVSDGADQDTAEIIQGLIRHIEYNSNADTAYDAAMEFAITTGGPGWIRVLTDYADENSFDQEIYIKPVKNPFSVYFDPSCNETDGSDARYAIVVEDLTREQYMEQYPDTKAADFLSIGTVGDAQPDWINHDGVRIAEYWWVDVEERTLAKLADGSTAILEESDTKPKLAKDRNGKPILRRTEKKTVRWVKTNGIEILEQGEWAGKFIPLVPVIGDEVIIDGKRFLQGIVRPAKDPCKQYNFMISAQTEAIALAPKSPFIGTKKQFEGYESMWKQANVKNYPFLPYTPDAQAGGPPQRQQFEPAIQAITMSIAQADNDIKATTAIYDASLGAPGPEQSGRAILARQQQGSTATLHFSDNLGRSLKHLGRILIDLIPKIYDTTRVVRILGDDETHKAVMIGDPQEAQNWQQGMERVYDLSVGRYDVAVSMGPSYNTRRQEAVDTLTQLVHAFPPFMQIAGDILVKNMDIPGAQQLAKRAEKMIPPQLQENGPQPPTPQMQALMQAHQQQSQQLQEALQVIQTKKIETDSKERIAAMQTWAQLAMAESKVNAQATMQMIQQEKDKLMQVQGMMHDSAHDVAMQASTQQFQAQQAQAAQQHQAGMQQQAAEQQQQNNQQS